MTPHSPARPPTSARGPAARANRPSLLGGARGSTLVEALVAAALLVAIVAGTAHLLIGVRRAAVQAELVEAATLAAQDRMEQLRAVPWGFDLGGAPIEAPELALSPPESLVTSMEGFEDRLGPHGGSVGGSASGGLVRRWAITRVGANEPEARLIEVCVAHAALHPSTPLVCLATIRARQP